MLETQGNSTDAHGIDVIAEDLRHISRNREDDVTAWREGSSRIRHNENRYYVKLRDSDMHQSVHQQNKKILNKFVFEIF